MKFALMLLLAGVLSLSAQTESHKDAPSKDAIQPAPEPALTPRAVKPPIPQVSGPTVVIPINGEVSKAQFIFLRRAIKEAERSNAGAILIHMDTYGGDLHASVDMVDALAKTRIPTVTYVDKNAGSAGALIALGTDRIYMAPVSAIGAAAPVMGGGENLPEAMNDKVISYFSKYFRSSAESKGHNPDIAEAFINKKKEVKIGERVISEKDSLLTLSPKEAVEVFNGRPLLASGIAENVDEVIKQAGLEMQKMPIDPMGFEVLALWITRLAPLFLMAGLVGVYIEFKTPGVGLPGILGGVCLAVYFLGHHLAGLTGMEVMAVFVIGIMLILAELIFFPGTIVLALAGTLVALGAIFYAMIDKYPTDPVLPTMEMITQPLIHMTITLVGSALAIAALAQFLPRTPIYRRLVLAGAVPTGGNISEPRHASVRAADLRAGDEGEAVTTIASGGKARIGGRLLDVTSEGMFIEKDSRVRIVSVHGHHVVVEQIL